jgi:3-hydroxy acid dehydrogenase/malonic semialdehyde reductase
MTDLASTTIFITGATSGFGEAAARRFAADGAKLILCGRRRDRLDALQADLKVPVTLITLDIRDRAAMLAAIDGLPDGFREVDILVNNAGLALGLDKAPQAGFDDWDAMVETNIQGLLTCTRALLPGMVTRQRGHIINLGSVASTYPYTGGNVYGASKAFVRQFSLNLRADLLGTKVRVTNIEPGACETEFSVVRFKGDQEKAAQVYAGMDPLTATDIAECIHWVAALPAHVNINMMEVMPVAQAAAGLTIHRT